MHCKLHQVCLVVGLVVLATLFGSPAQATDIPVTTPDDTLRPDGYCSLREAIEAANTDAVVDGCPAGAGPDVILLPAAVITLTVTATPTDTNASGDLDILAATTLQGSDARHTVIDGSGIDRILEISATAVVTVADLTLTNGHAQDGAPSNDVGAAPGPGENGGAILNWGTLTLLRVTVSASRAGDGGRVGMAFPPWDAGVAGMGGGIYNSGVLTLAQCAVISNTAGKSGAVSALHYMQTASGGDGGGIYNTGALAVINSTVGYNSAPDGEDAVVPINYVIKPGAGGSGGGIYTTGRLVADNVTLAGNTAGHGGLGTDGYYTITAASGLGGGLFVTTTTDAAVRNTLLADNYIDATASDCAGMLASRDFNLIRATAGCTITGSVANNRYGVNPSLGPLGVHSGTTPTFFAPYAGAAVDRGSCQDSRGASILVDQVGTPRPQLGGCDIGAVEATLPAHFLYYPLIGR